MGHEGGQVLGEAVGLAVQWRSFAHAGKKEVEATSHSKVKADRHFTDRMQFISKGESSPGNNTLHRQSVGLLRLKSLQNMGWLVCMSWIIS